MRQGASQVLSGFLTWWLGQLAELLPPGFRAAGTRSPDAVLIVPTQPLNGDGEVAICHRRNGKEAMLGRYPLAPATLPDLLRSPRLPVVVRLRASDVLQTTLTLPLAAQADLDQVLSFEMDRQTPFSADEVYWNHQIEDVDRPRGTISVRLTLLPKAHLAKLLTTLARARVAPRWAELDDPGYEGPYLPLDGGHGPKHRTPRLLWPVAVCCAVLAVGAVATPFIRQATELAALDHEIEAVRPAATQAEALRREVDQLSRNADLVKAELDKAGRPLEVLAAITRLLPDDTYLIEAELRRRKVTLTGRSAGAARLIAALAIDGRFRNPAFAAPVTRIEALRAEVFTIVAEVEPLP